MQRELLYVVRDGDLRVREKRLWTIPGREKAVRSGDFYCHVFDALRRSGWSEAQLVSERSEGIKAIFLLNGAPEPSNLPDDCMVNQLRRSLVELSEFDRLRLLNQYQLLRRSMSCDEVRLPETFDLSCPLQRCDFLRAYEETNHIHILLRCSRDFIRARLLMGDIDIVSAAVFWLQKLIEVHPDSGKWHERFVELSRLANSIVFDDVPTNVSFKLSQPLQDEICDLAHAVRENFPAKAINAAKNSWDVVHLGKAAQCSGSVESLIAAHAQCSDTIVRRCVERPCLFGKRAAPVDYAQLVAVLQMREAPPQIYVFDYPFSVRHHVAGRGMNGQGESSNFSYGSKKVFHTQKPALGVGWLPRTKVAVRHFLKKLLNTMLPFAGEGSATLRRFEIFSSHFTIVEDGSVWCSGFFPHPEVVVSRVARRYVRSAVRQLMALLDNPETDSPSSPDCASESRWRQL